MHNKLMVADNAVALVGGRNVSDDYFEVAEAPKRFGDFDLAVVGPVVPELSHNFDAFWNWRCRSRWRPWTGAGDGSPGGEARTPKTMPLATCRSSHAASTAASPCPPGMSGRAAMAWVARGPSPTRPEKAKATPATARTRPPRRMLATQLRACSRELVVISPYLIPGDDGLAAIRALRERDVRVRALTNSLASTDVPIVHTAYRKYREPL